MWASSRANLRKTKRIRANMWDKGIPRRHRANNSHLHRNLRSWITKMNLQEIFRKYIIIELLKSRARSKSRRLLKDQRPILLPLLMRKRTIICMIGGTTWFHLNMRCKMPTLKQERNLSYHTQVDLWSKWGYLIFLQRGLMIRDKLLLW